MWAVLEMRWLTSGLQREGARAVESIALQSLQLLTSRCRTGQGLHPPLLGQAWRPSYAEAAPAQYTSKLQGQAGCF